MNAKEEEKTTKAETQPLSRVLAEQSATFLSETSLHGMHNVSKKERHKIGRAVWLLMVLAMGCWLVSTLTHQFGLYFSFPHVTRLSVTQTHSLPLPAVSLCLWNPLDSRRLHVAFPHTDQLLQRFFTSPSSLNWSDPHVRHVMSNVTVQQVMDTASFNVDEVFMGFDFLYSSGMKKPHIWDAYFEVPVRCYTFNGTHGWDPLLKLKNQVHLQFRVPQTTVIRFPGIGVRDMTVVIHQPWDMPFSFDLKETPVAFGTSVSFTLSAKKFHFLPAPYYSMGGQDCVDVHSGGSLTRLQYFQTYSHANCLMEKAFSKMMALCSCMPFELVGSYTAPHCTLMQVHECYIPFYATAIGNVLIDPGQCPWECQMTWVDIKTTAIPSRHCLSEEGTLDCDHRDIRDSVILMVGYETDLVVVNEHVPAITLDTIYSTVGGQMGLFLGASLLTITEVLEHVICLLWTACKHFRSVRRVQVNS